MQISRLLSIGSIAALALTATACAPTAEGGADDGTVQVLASFYPLQYVVERVGGEHVDVNNLTPPSAEPHDLELSPAQARAIGDAGLVVYLSGFQPAVDEGIEQRAPQHVVDAADAADLEEDPAGGHEGETAEEHADEEAAEEAPAEEDEHGHGAATDPHFWLDPVRLTAVAQQVADELAAVDPDNADSYAAGASALEADLTALDEQYTDQLAPCADATLVTSHEAFGYLAGRYDLNLVGIAGIDPESEVAPARLREIREIVQTNDVSTLYLETVAAPQTIETLASDLGVGTATLDPLESQADADADYLDVMEANLDALAGGLTCS
ncbi:zinc transport system substrate-binding protein [Promicromonospora umidemergens]|nr:metal ABC transporter substrate-binding protein [Promicromonospora umidemergens]MCP2286753.1 zinc transport system substrate-binding protein [Promicromonospora umidemergens]